LKEKPLSQTATPRRARLIANLRALGLDLAWLPQIPEALGDYIAKLTSEDLERIRADVRELERIGLLPPSSVTER
jgi:hypothetical protein